MNGQVRMQEPCECVQSVIVPTGIEKECPECGTVKLRADFYSRTDRKDGLGIYCRKCCNAASRKRYAANLESERANALQRYANNRERAQEIATKWKSNNPEKVKALARKADMKKRATPAGRLNGNMRSALKGSLKRGAKANCHWGSLAGYTLAELKACLEKQFLPGMTWANYGLWHIDHKIPISAFNFETPADLDFKRCWSLKNLRPLWAGDNIRKKDKLAKPFQPSLMIRRIEP